MVHCLIYKMDLKDKPELISSKKSTQLLDVYYKSILVQLLITVLMCVISYVSPAFVKFQTDNYGLFYAAMGLMLVS